MKILVFIPAFNEENNIEEVLKTTMEVTEHYPNVDFLVVDDGSIDGTAKITRSCGVNLISHQRNMGEEAAIQTAFEYAIKNNYDYTVKLDADGEHDPKDIPKILKPLLNGKADVVIGSRYLGTFRILSRESNLFKLARCITSFLISMLIRRWLTDPTSGFKGRNRKAFMLSRFLYTNTSFLHTDLTNDIQEILFFLKNGLKIIEVPVNMIRKQAFSRCYHPTGLLRYSLELIMTVLRYMLS